MIIYLSNRQRFRKCLLFNFGTIFVARAILLLIAGLLATWGDEITVDISQSAYRQFRLGITNTVSKTHSIESSTDLIHWKTVSDASLSGLDIFMDDHAPVTFYRAVSPDFNPAAFSIITSNLVANVAPGNLIWNDGSTTEFAGGSIQLFPTFTNYIVLNLGTFNLHALSRSIGDDSVLLGVVTTGTTSAISTAQSPIIVASPAGVKLCL